MFGPKIVATRQTYADRALESRFITEEMGTKQFRKDIPISLPAIQQQEALILRNKLLMYRFRTFHKKQIKPHFFRHPVEPRIKQIFAPLISVTDDLDLQEQLDELATNLSEQIKTDRGNQIEAKLLTCIQASDRSIKRITEIFGKRFGNEYPTITNRWIGELIRKRLGLRTQKTSGVYVIPNEEEPKLQALYERYGIDDLDITIEPIRDDGGEQVETNDVIR